MFPLQQKSLIRGSTAHIRAGLGAGVDYHAYYEPLYAPFDITISRLYWGAQGGNWLTFIHDGISFEFAHLSSYKVKAGQSVKTGTIIAITGNTGAITTMPHLHIQGIKNGKRVYLDNYNWGQAEPQPQPPAGEYMSRDEFKGIVSNIVNGWYNNYLLRPANQGEVDSHTNAIMADYDNRKSNNNHPEYAVSEWVNKQNREAEFIAHWKKV
jgi:murein DD-endopeptidase MepM/ murein hydrolase activator NlpD